MSIPTRLSILRDEIRVAALTAGYGPVGLLAISKQQPSTAIAHLAAQGQRAFGENYVQEARGKIDDLKSHALEWHLVGHLQSNKAELAAQLFDWIHTIDRAKLIQPLAYCRPVNRPPLNTLIQVNIDDEASKHGCSPACIPTLASLIAEHPQLRLRGLMAIPSPHPDNVYGAFQRMRSLFDQLRQYSAHVDTLSMGMSVDFKQAIACGATLVRLGTALFGPRLTLQS